MALIENEIMLGCNKRNFQTSFFIFPFKISFNNASEHNIALLWLQFDSIYQEKLSQSIL